MIRRITENDIDWIVNLELDTIGTTLGADMLKGELNNPMSYIFVYELDNRVGYISTVFDGEILEILNICVDKACQSKGIGTKMIGEVLKYFYLKNATSVILEVRESNIRAIHVYEKLGFKNISIRKKYYSNGENAIVMQKLFTPYIDIEMGYRYVESKIERFDGYYKLSNDNNKTKYYNNYYLIDEEADSKAIVASLMDKPINGNLIFVTKENLNLEGFEVSNDVNLYAPIAILERPYKECGRVVEVSNDMLDELRQFLYDDGICYGEIFATDNSNEFIRCIESKKMTAYVLLIDEKITGFIWAYTLGDAAKLEDFFIEESNQNKGYGSFLFMSVIEMLKKKGIKDAFLAADRDDYPIKMYESMGFVPVGDNYFQRKE